MFNRDALDGHPKEICKQYRPLGVGRERDQDVSRL